MPSSLLRNENGLFGACEVVITSLKYEAMCFLMRSVARIGDVYIGQCEGVLSDWVETRIRAHILTWCCTMQLWSSSALAEWLVGQSGHSWTALLILFFVIVGQFYGVRLTDCSM